jgi:peptidyl-prolyl cis-trans isomerase A (cyclophilin A)
MCPIPTDNRLLRGERVLLQGKSLMKKILFALTMWSISCAAIATNVVMETPLGNIEIELFDEETPKTVENFLNYVNDGDYEDSFMHRSIPGFVIQGGGFNFKDGEAGTVPEDPPVENEFNRSNIRGTIAMAKQGGDPDSANSQWFINLDDNSDNLDGSDGQGGGFFTVFGQVIGNGMEIADAIAALPIAEFASPFTDLPVIDFSGGDILEENLVFSNVVLAEDPLPSFEINPGLSGSWFNPDTSGQGWLLDVVARDTGLEMFVAWFTYDVNPPPADETDGFGSRQHRWFTALGSVSGDTAVMDIFLNSGGVFNDPREPQSEPVGSMTIQFSDCSNAQLSFDFDDSDDNDDSLAVVRLSPDVFCQAIIDTTQQVN